MVFGLPTTYLTMVSNNSLLRSSWLWTCLLMLIGVCYEAKRWLCFHQIGRKPRLWRLFEGWNPSSFNTERIENRATIFWYNYRCPGASWRNLLSQHMHWGRMWISASLGATDNARRERHWDAPGTSHSLRTQKIAGLVDQEDSDVWYILCQSIQSICLRMYFKE